MSDKSKVAAGVLGILLGALGVHRFYLGYTTIGVVQLVIAIVGGLLTAGVLTFLVGIWGTVEGVLILTGGIKTDARGLLLE